MPTHNKQVKILILSQILICLYVGLGCQAKTENFGILKSMILNRSNEAKVYIPDRAVIGGKIEIIIEAPGASKVILFQGNEAGASNYEDAELRLGPDYVIVGESNKSPQSFAVYLPLEQYTDLVDKDIYFDAIAEYQTEQGIQRKNATFFGANAAYSNLNTVRVIAPAKSTAGTEALMRSIAPGLLNRPTQF
jgi:hypothetical protein